MKILLIGGSGSGKSLLAEKISVSLKNNKLYYLATMRISDDECRQRVKKHQLQRASKGFETVEVPENLYESMDSIESGQVILLECMSNLLANEQFSGFTDNPVEKIIHGIEVAFDKSESVVIVSNEIFSDRILKDKQIREYVNNLGKINSWIAEKSDIVIEVTSGIPVIFKGNKLFGEIGI